jgi:hypothetical protein
MMYNLFKIYIWFIIIYLIFIEAYMQDWKKTLGVSDLVPRQCLDALDIA